MQENRVPLAESRQTASQRSESQPPENAVRMKRQGLQVCGTGQTSKSADS